MAALFAPSIPGASQETNGSPLSSGGPLSMLAAMMGGSRSKPQSTGDKMAQVVQLLREISREDPRVGMLTSEALRVLIEGGMSSMVPKTPMGAPMAGQNQGPMALGLFGGTPLSGGAGGGVPPMGSPGGMIV